MRRSLNWSIAAALTCAAMTHPSDAEAGAVLGFQGITNNNSTDVAIGEAQMSLAVSDEGGGLVRFQFSNSGPESSSITDIYFDDSVTPTLFNSPIYGIDNSVNGVSFSEGASPGSLPGGQSIGFNATKGLTADSDAPVSWNGVNPGESVGVILELTSGHQFDSVITALADRSLRVGIHVQQFASGGSESFVNGGGGSTPGVPEPASAIVFGVGLLGAGVQRLRRRTKSQEVAAE
ncbi:MAG: PEP-CTERM sorting domain-containing protein [Planctomycetota bacterium]|nr:PEP-CTERM sorting domain-containing protein [Planctomycetota bacterium]